MVAVGAVLVLTSVPPVLVRLLELVPVLVCEPEPIPLVDIPAPLPS
jgi:hypothetical protein